MNRKAVSNIITLILLILIVLIVILILWNVVRRTIVKMSIIAQNDANCLRNYFEITRLKNSHYEYVIKRVRGGVLKNPGVKIIIDDGEIKNLIDVCKNMITSPDFSQEYTSVKCEFDKNNPPYFLIELFLEIEKGYICKNSFKIKVDNIFDFPGELILNPDITKPNELFDFTGIQPVIAVDTDDNAHIVHVRRKGLNYEKRYCNNVNNKWTCETITNLVDGDNTRTSISLDSNNKVHLVQNSKDENSVIYCNNINGWLCDTVEERTVDEDINPVIVTDSNNNLHVVYYDNGNAELRYCYKNILDNDWNCDKIITFGGGRDPNYFLTVDPNNNLHLSLSIPDITDLRYCSKFSGSSIWNCELVENTGRSGYMSSIAIDSKNTIHISHYDSSNKDLRYCYKAEGSLTWNCELIEYNGDTGRYPSINVNSNNVVHIIYIDQGNSELRICSKNNNNWNCEKLASLIYFDIGFNQISAIKKGGSQNIHVIYSDNQKLYYLRKVI